LAGEVRADIGCTVEACVAAGIAQGEVVHIDSSPVRADVS
jgi:hypothetical protein